MANVKDIIRPLFFAGKQMKTNLVLAPLAGTSSWPFRLLCQRYGCGWTVTELVSARGIKYDPLLVHQLRYLAIHPEEEQTAIQLFAADPADLEYAIQQILSHPDLCQTAFIDINMGCPVKKVIKTGAGSAILDKPDLALELCRAAVKAADNYGKKITVKIRSGVREPMKDLVSFVKGIEDTGVAGIVVHPRLTVQMYGGESDWSIICKVKAAVNIPVVGNGDLKSAQGIIAMAEKTGADAFMIGRAARGNPWLFKDIADFFDRQKEEGTSEIYSFPEFAGRDLALKTFSFDPQTKEMISEWRAVILRHLQGMKILLGEDQAVREMRKQLLFYTRKIPFSSAIRQQLMAAVDTKEINLLLLQLEKKENYES